MRLRTVEVHYFSDLLASLIVKAARATSDEEFAEVHKELEEAFVDVFSLVTHDALGGLDEIVLGRARVDGSKRVRA